jgi:hypothetical protein
LQRYDDCALIGNAVTLEHRAGFGKRVAQCDQLICRVYGAATHNLHELIQQLDAIQLGLSHGYSRAQVPATQCGVRISTTSQRIASMAR